MSFFIAKGALKELQERIKTLATENKPAELLPLLLGTVFYPLALESAAKAGHTKLVSDLLLELGVTLASDHFSESDMALLNSALLGYAAGLHFEKVGELVKKGANIGHGLNALISAGEVTPKHARELIAVAGEAASSLESQISILYGKAFFTPGYSIGGK